jgi:hypothetical protein
MVRGRAGGGVVDPLLDLGVALNRIAATIARVRREVFLGQGAPVVRPSQPQLRSALAKYLRFNCRERHVSLEAEEKCLGIFSFRTADPIRD